MKRRMPPHMTAQEALEQMKQDQAAYDAATNRMMESYVAMQKTTSQMDAALTELIPPIRATLQNIDALNEQIMDPFEWVVPVKETWEQADEQETQ